jgi:hypothetical protein
VCDGRWSPLHVACAHGHAAVAAALLQVSAASLTARAECEQLLAAVRAHAATDEGRAAQRAGVPMPVVSAGNAHHQPRTPLALAALLGHLGVVKALVEHPCGGAAVLEGSCGGDDMWEESPLTCAAHGNHEAVVHYLLDRGADVRRTTGWAASALCVAAASGNVALMRTLLHRGATANLPPGALQGATGPLFAAVRGGRADAVQLLLERGARVDGDPFMSVDDMSTRFTVSKAPLHAAVRSGRTDVAVMLLDAGADVQMRVEGYLQPTALHVAAHNGDEAMVALLLARGADVQRLTGVHTSWREGEQSAVQHAAEGGEEETPSTLAPGGSAAAATSRHARCAELLIAAGLHPDECGDYMGETPLLKLAYAHARCQHPAGCAARSLEALARVLLAHGADPMAQSTSGDTPLETATGRLLSLMQQHVSQAPKRAAAEAAEALRAEAEAEAREARGAPARRGAAVAACADKRMRVV